MRYLILILAIISCNKKDSPPTQTQQGIIIDVKKNEKLSTGQIVEKDVEISALHIWKADGRNFEIKSNTDAIGGYAFDKISNTSIKSDYVSLLSHFATQVPTGQYFIYVSLGSNVVGARLAYSTTTAQVTSGQNSNLKKVFTTRATFASFEDWNAVE